MPSNSLKAGAGVTETLPNETQSHPTRRQTHAEAEKGNRSETTGLGVDSTYSQCNLAACPSLEHRTHGPGSSVPRGSQETPKGHAKIGKIGDLDLKAAVGCPRGPLEHQNGHAGSAESILQISGLNTQSDSSQRATSQQLPATKWTGGRGEA